MVIYSPHECSEAIVINKIVEIDFMTFPRGFFAVYFPLESVLVIGCRWKIQNLYSQPPPSAHIKYIRVSIPLKIHILIFLRLTISSLILYNLLLLKDSSINKENVKNMAQEIPHLLLVCCLNMLQTTQKSIPSILSKNG